MRGPFVTGFIIGMFLIFAFLIALFVQGKLSWENKEKPLLEMPRANSPKIEQPLDSLHDTLEVLSDTLQVEGSKRKN